MAAGAWLVTLTAADCSHGRACSARAGVLSKLLRGARRDCAGRGLSCRPVTVLQSRLLFKACNPGGCGQGPESPTTGSGSSLRNPHPVGFFTPTGLFPLTVTFDLISDF